MPVISVIVPVYKAEALLKTCIDSILGQTFRDLELILVDDGSPDGSGVLCDQAAAEDSRVRVIHKENGGVSRARNDGIAAAQGEYLAFCDADDYILPNTLEALYAALTRAGADTAGCGHRLLWPDGRTEDYAGALPAGVYGPEELREGIVKPLLGQRLDFGQGVLNGFIVRYLFRREVVLDNAIAFEGAYLEDELFLMEYCLHAQRLAMVDEPFYVYLQNPASVTRRYLPRYREEFSRFLERKRALVKRHGLDGLCPGWEENTCWAGLLIAVGNEFAPGNPKPMGERSAYVKALCAQPEMARAIASLKPKGLAGNKQLVADLLLGRHYTLLALLYRIKNRGK